MQHAREAEDACRRLDDTLLMQIGSLMGSGADEDTASQLEKLQADRDPYAAGAAADLGKSLLEFDEANEKRQQNIVNDLDEKIARGDAGVKIAEERAARRQKLAGLIEEEKRAAEVERQINAMLAELQTRSDALKKTIADTEATRAALGQSDAEQLKIEHRIELAEGLTATCATLLQDLDKAKAAKADAEEKQHAYAEAQAALDELETAHIAMQRQLNANRAGLLAQELVDGQPCPVCGAVHHPHPAALPQDHVTEKALEDHEKTLTAQRRKTADASRAAGDAAAHAAELRATLLREADAFFARRGARYEGKPAAELTPDELWDTLLAQQKSLADGLAGLQADHKKFKQQADKARALADQLDNLNRQLAGLEKQAFAATRKSANAKAGHAAAAARVQQMQETMPKREDPDTLPKLQAALSRLRADRATAMAARDARRAPPAHQPRRAGRAGQDDAPERCRPGQARHVGQPFQNHQRQSGRQGQAAL